MCHAQTLEILYSLFWLRPGVTRVGILVLLFRCWPGMVPNQRQLSIIASDWGSYLGSLFPLGFCGILFLCSACEHSITSRFICFCIVLVSFNN